MNTENTMKRIAMFAFGLLVLTAASAFSAGPEKAAALPETAAAAPRTPLVGAKQPGLKPMVTKVAAADGKECSCSEWRSVTTEECVAWDSQGQCAKYQTVTKRECVAWDHCH